MYPAVSSNMVRLITRGWGSFKTDNDLLTMFVLQPQFYHSLSWLFIPFDPLDQLDTCPGTGVRLCVCAALGAATWSMGIDDFNHSWLES